MEHSLARAVPARLMPRLEHFFMRYGSAVLVTLGVTAVRILLDPLLRNQASYLPYLLGVLIVVRLAGALPALVALVLGAIMGMLLFSSALIVAGTVRWDEVVILLIYFLVGMGIIRAFDKLDRHSRSLQAEIATHQETERRLRASEERLLLALLAGQMGVWEWDIRKGTLVWDDTMYALHGMPAQSPLDLNAYWKLIHPEDQKALKARPLDQPFESEYRVVRPDGQLRWIAGLEHIVRDADGTMTGKIGINFDITERKRAERRAALLLELTNALSTSLKTADVIDVISDQGLAAMGAQSLGGGISLLTDDGDILKTTFFGESTQITALGHREHEVPLSTRSPMADAVRTMQPVWIEDLKQYHALYPHMSPLIDQMVGTQAVACLPLMIQEDAIGGLCVTFDQAHPFTPVERSFMLSIAQVCAQALERARLFEREQELTVLQERQHLARELHDSVSQTMFAATTMAEGLPRLWQRNAEDAFPILEQIVTLNRSAYAEMRTLLLELRPEVIVKTPLSQLMRQLCEAVKGKKMMTVTLTLPEQDFALPPQAHMEIYRIAQEAISNIVKHSGANNLALILTGSQSEIDLLIKDDGDGFDPKDMTGGIGMMAMRERAQAIGACLEITSAVGQGTSIHLRYGAATPDTATGS